MTDDTSQLLIGRLRGDKEKKKKYILNGAFIMNFYE